MGLNLRISRNCPIQEWVPPKLPGLATISSSFLAAWSLGIAHSLRLASLLFSPTILLFDTQAPVCYIQALRTKGGALLQQACPQDLLIFLPSLACHPHSLLRLGCLFSQDSQPWRWGRGLQSLAQSPCQALICMQKGLGGIYHGLALGSCSRPRNALPMAVCSGQD